MIHLNTYVNIFTYLKKMSILGNNMVAYYFKYYLFFKFTGHNGPFFFYNTLCVLFINPNK